MYTPLLDSWMPQVDMTLIRDCRGVSRQAHSTIFSLRHPRETGPSLRRSRLWFNPPQASRIAGLLRKSLLLLPEPGQGLPRGDGVEVEIAQRGGELLGRSWHGFLRRLSRLVPRLVLFPDQTLSVGQGMELGWRLGEKHLGAVGDPRWQTRQPRYLNAVGAVGWAGLHRVEKDDAAFPLESRDVDVRHPRQLPRDGG